MYYYKLFIWKNGKKETDLTKYLLAPIFLEDRLNEELSTGEVILDAVPRELYPTPFAPKTKMRIERYKDKDFKDKIKHWDMVIEHDDIEEYTGCHKYLCHRIHLIEPSVIAQGMHVDNIALTYELQDVTTEYKTYRTDTTGVVPSSKDGVYEKAEHKAALVDFDLGVILPGSIFFKYFLKIAMHINGIKTILQNWQMQYKKSTMCEMNILLNLIFQDFIVMVVVGVESLTNNSFKYQYW